MSCPNNNLIKMITNHTEQLIQKINELINENKKLKQEQKELSDFINNHIEKFSKKTFDTSGAISSSIDNIELDMTSYDYFNTSLLFPNIKLEYHDFSDLPPLIAINKPIHPTPRLETEITNITNPTNPTNPNLTNSTNPTNPDPTNPNPTNPDSESQSDNVLKKIINNGDLIATRPKTGRYNKKRPSSKLKKIEKPTN